MGRRQAGVLAFASSLISLAYWSPIISVVLISSSASTIVSAAVSACPWGRDPKLTELRAACLCATNIAQQLSVQVSFYCEWVLSARICVCLLFMYVCVAVCVTLCRGVFVCVCFFICLSVCLLFVSVYVVGVNVCERGGILFVPLDLLSQMKITASSALWSTSLCSQPHSKNMPRIRQLTW